MTFEALLVSYIQALDARHVSQAARKSARYVLPRFFDHLRHNEIHQAHAVQEAHVVSYLHARALETTRYGTPPAAWTLHAALTVLRGFFAHLRRSGVILEDPTLGVRLKRPDRLPRAVLSELHLARLMSAPFPNTLPGLRDRAILELLYGTGMRRSECVRTNLVDLDLRERILLIRNGKGRKDRLVPVPGRAAAALDVYLRDVRPYWLRDGHEQALFLSQRRRRLSAEMLLLLVRNAAHRIDLKATPHALRHACATHLLRRGADVRHVQELLGHSSVQTTAMYTQIALRDLRQALARLDRRGRSARRSP